MRLIQYMDILIKTENELRELMEHGQHTEKTKNIQQFDYLTKKVAHYKSLIENTGKGTILKCTTSEGDIFLVNTTREEAQIVLEKFYDVTLISAQEIPAGLILS